jgi:hypothetical protein
VEVSANDGVNTTAELITVYLTDMNEAPTAVALINATASIAENISTASNLKVADIWVADDALGTNILSLTGADAASFEIVGSALYLKAGTVLDFESNTSYAVAVTVDDPTLPAPSMSSTSSMFPASSSLGQVLPTRLMRPTPLLGNRSRPMKKIRSTLAVETTPSMH